MANKKFMAGGFSGHKVPAATPDKGNKPKVNDNHSIAEPKKEGTFAKKLPSRGRPQGTWGGGYGRP